MSKNFSLPIYEEDLLPYWSPSSQRWLMVFTRSQRERYDSRRALLDLPQHRADFTPSLHLIGRVDDRH